eukprot:1157097-Pelagomonas_calceolata.AAC.7
MVSIKESLSHLEPEQQQFGGLGLGKACCLLAKPLDGVTGLNWANYAACLHAKHSDRDLMKACHAQKRKGHPIIHPE